MKNLLIKGVRIFENSEVRELVGNTAKTHLGSVNAKNILICVDKLKKREINEEFSKKSYHMQTYLAVSEPLSKKEVKSMFPKRRTDVLGYESFIFTIVWLMEIDFLSAVPVLGQLITQGIITIQR